MNTWSCLPSACAIIMDIPLEQLLQVIGHDGSEVVFSSQHRGFHIQEIAYAARFFDYAIVQYDRYPLLSWNNEGFEIPDWKEKFEQLLYSSQGVIAGIMKNTSRYHAVAWNGIDVINPSGRLISLNDIEPLYYFTIQSTRKVDID
jgi:hypothetical protein